MSRYFWCLTHQRVEEGATCRAADRLGPYDTPAAARAWRDRVDQRQETWEAEDERWTGEGADNGDD